MERGGAGSTVQAEGGGTLIMMVGLPATGKSYLARRLAERLDAVMVQSDSLRKAMFREPRYTSRESFAVYAEAHRRLARHLRAGRTVVFDATNLAERKRRIVYDLVEEAASRLVIVLTYSPVETVRRRLAGREAGEDPLDRSDADWAVYRKMGRADPIPRPHLVVNTTLDLEQAVELVAARAGGE